MASGDHPGYTRSRHKLQLNQQPSATPATGPGAGPQRQPQQQSAAGAYKVSNFKLVRASPGLLHQLRQQASQKQAGQQQRQNQAPGGRGRALTWARQAPPQPAAATPVQQAAAARPQPPKAPAQQQQRQPAVPRANPPAPSRPALPAAKPGGRTVSVVKDAGGQQRVLVYSKTKKGNSLQRTAVKAAAGGRGSLSWRNPALPPVPAARKAPPASKPAPSPPKAKWNKFVRQGGGGLPVPRRLAAVQVPAAPRLSPRQRQQQQPASSGPKQHTLGRKLPRTAGAKLLRLGSSMYKASTSGKSRSLRRQPSSPAQDQQQPGRPSAAAAALGAQPLLKPAGAASLSTARRAAMLVAARASAGKKALVLKPLGGVTKLKLRKFPPRAAISSTSKRASSGGTGIVYCPLYCRTGACERRSRGCPYRHDPTKRAVCPRWLRGCCQEQKCPLQHQRKAELMPVCMHFLKGLCSSSSCPYLHVHLPATAPVCKRFLRGYCPAGAVCPHKHYTLRMLREEKRLDSGGQQEAGGGIGSRKRSSGGASQKRYFEGASPGAEPKRARTTAGEERRGQADAGKEQEEQQLRRRDSDALKPAFLLGDEDMIPL